MELIVKNDLSNWVPASIISGIFIEVSWSEGHSLCIIFMTRYTGTMPPYTA